MEIMEMVIGLKDTIVITEDLKELLSGSTKYSKNSIDYYYWDFIKFHYVDLSPLDKLDSKVFGLITIDEDGEVVNDIGYLKMSWDSKKCRPE